MKRKYNERKLTRLILGALLMGGAIFAPDVAMAAEVTWDGALDVGGDPTNVTPDNNAIKLMEPNPGEINGYIDESYVNQGYKILTLSGAGNDGLGQVAAGSKLGGVVEGFTLNVNGGTWNSVCGAVTSMGTVSKNTVNIFGGTIRGDVYGGYGYGVNGLSYGSATDNIVNIKGGSGYTTIAGGYSEHGNATSNTVTISGDTTNITGNVYGGKTGYGGGDAKGNTVTISGGTVGTVGNYSGIYGGTAGNGSASNNAVTITGGTINADIYGGSGNTANNNTVSISGNTVFGKDGMDEYYGIHGGMGNGDVMNNTVNILTKITVGNLIGGESYGGGTSSGNTLNIAAVGVETNNMGYFQNLNFFLPTDMTKEDVMLKVNGTATVDGAKVGVMAQGKLANLTKDDKVTLLHAETLNGTVSQTTEKIVKPTSLTTVDTYEFSVISDANNIYATITKDDSGSGGGGDDPTPSPSPDDPDNDIKKSPAEVRAATVTMLNAGADMLASQGFAQAANAVAIEAAEQAKNGVAEGTNGAVGAPVVRSFTPFAAFGGSSLRAESGSHVDAKGFGINVGFAKEFTNSQGKLLFGPVVEYGGGKYDSYNNDVHGDGSSHYWGFGLMARQTEP